MLAASDEPAHEPAEDTEDYQTADDVPEADDGDEPIEWHRPRFADGRHARERMVREQIAAPGRDVSDVRVLEAMRQVPRHLFVPVSEREYAHEDNPLPIGYGQTISQPFIVAYMTEALSLEAGERVLEVGTGSGYQAAVLSELTPYVFTVEIIRELGEQARERLKGLGYETVEVKIGDGYFGWNEHSPFDAIIVTCAAGHIPPPLLRQLRAGGRMIIPVGGPYWNQYLILVTKGDNGEISSRLLMPVAFVPMTGAAKETR